jgi:hypothetical protein
MNPRKTILEVIMGIATLGSYVPSPTNIGFDLALVYESKENHP